MKNCFCAIVFAGGFGLASIAGAQVAAGRSAQILSEQTGKRKHSTPVTPDYVLAKVDDHHHGDQLNIEIESSGVILATGQLESGKTGVPPKPFTRVLFLRPTEISSLKAQIERLPQINITEGQVSSCPDYFTATVQPKKRSAFNLPLTMDAVAHKEAYDQFRQHLKEILNRVDNEIAPSLFPKEVRSIEPDFGFFQELGMWTRCIPAPDSDIMAVGSN